MAWFRNYYLCSECGHEWEDEWSCMCNDDCPACGARHFEPYNSDDLSVIVEPLGDQQYAILYSPPEAEHEPDYRSLATVAGRSLAAMCAKIATSLSFEAPMDDELTAYDGWLGQVYRCAIRVGKPEFTLADVYQFEEELAERYPGNQHVREKIRQQLQRLRELGEIEFLGGGAYRLR